ncbi:MAG TPA: S1 RNA-binding domain-containing protein [Polyangiaceae bacterium]|jgi:small subunit ribosomal protein S1|nr:S1 RNA-binding domain-containing protein [Polyangiaceae bacterium]
MKADSFASLFSNSGGADRARRRLSRGEVLDASVVQIASDFVFVDVGTTSDGRIPRADLLDADGKVRVAVGDRLRVSVVEPRYEGSLLRALGQSAPPDEAPRADEVLTGKVTRLEKFGIFVATPKGDGLVPLRELPLPPGSDHRKLFPVGKELQLVVLDVNPQGKLRFSATRVSRVEEEQNFRDFAAASAAPESKPEEAAKGQPPKKPNATSGFGSLGDLMREKFGHAVPAPQAEKASATPAKGAPQKAAPKQPSTPPHAERNDVIRRKR